MVIKDKQKEQGIAIKEEMPLLPLRDIVVFPYMVMPLFVGREQSIKALEEATMEDRLIFLVSQKKATIDNPTSKDLYTFGIVAELLQLLKLPDGTIKVLVEGLARARAQKFSLRKGIYYAHIEIVEEEFLPTKEITALMRTVTGQFEDYVGLSKRFPPETLSIIHNVEEPGRLADIVAAHLNLKVEQKQNILEIVNPAERLEKLSGILISEIEILEIEKKIHGRVRGQMEKAQKEYYLGERMRAIQKELGRRDDLTAEIEELKGKIKTAGMSKEAEDKVNRELERLERMPPMAAETAVVRNYIDWILALPWKKKTRDKLNINQAEKILEEEHYGLTKVKERAVEYLAVRKLVKKMKGPILCFTGPPGTGKTSVARSIARALGREFVRLSLGGVRDEAEIRGHRMTYVAALPGRIIQSMRKAGSKNPVFLLDEIDKMSTDFRGDPSAALLEVLDPEQNSTFSDHYLEVPFDLSDVMFITTANMLYSIPPPLRDRMEVLDFPSYIETEKLKIGELFLIPKVLKNHGLTPTNLIFSKEALLSIIRRYTREAGVRNLERELSAICRKVAKEVVSKGKRTVSRVKITAGNLHCYLGPARYRFGLAETEKETIGVATGLAWTEAGGDILTIEVVVMSGKGDLILTGKLGDVMKESARASLSYTRSKASELKLEAGFHRKKDIHIHVPEGAIPKDGPSAGITMATAIISALTNRPVNREVAMTGEITLQGRVLPVGGIKEKILSAHRAGIKTVLIPEENEKDLVDIPNDVKRKLTITLIKHMDDVLKIALGSN
ncbi:MAG: endopeptidase La [bacterium]|nr:endopeptidase La [bacterium]